MMIWLRSSRPSVRQRDDGGSPAARQMSRVKAPVEVPEDIVERVRALCLALPVAEEPAAPPATFGELLDSLEADVPHVQTPVTAQPPEP